jgi:serine/threonine kinase 16
VSIVRELAEGGFGMVYLVEDCTRGKRYALKQLLCQSREQIAEAHNELDVLRRFQGKSDGTIIELLDYTAAGGQGGGAAANQTKQVLMLFPIYPAGTLLDHIADATQSSSRTWPFPEPTALYLTMCAAEALQVLHRDGLAHRDVKPHNFLLEEIPEQVQARQNIPSAYRAVLMDLGSVTTARIQVRNKKEALILEEEAAGKTSAPYRSPELTSPPFPPFQIDERVDTWGLGCTLYCIAFGRSPFETPKEGVLRLAILNGKYSTPPGNRNKDCVYSDGFMDLIAHMLSVDINQRPHVEEVIQTCGELLANYT